jgi:ParB family transcriptional regulator, chromosome partitioning protein
MSDAKQKLDFMFGLSPEMPRIIEIELTKLRRNPDQPRKVFNEETIKELAASIEHHGLIQPISVVPDSESQDGFMIVAGERRYRAHEHLGRPTITAIITKGNSDEIALIENIQREDLSPVDQAEGLANMMTKHGYKQEELAKVIGKARTTVTELLSLNTLPDEIKNECRTSDMASKSALIEIVRLGNAKDQLKLWEDMKQGGMRTVRAARAMKSGKKEPSVRPVTKPKKLFHTEHKASVIVQSETSQLTQEQITAALREALEQSERSNK